MKKLAVLFLMVIIVGCGSLVDEDNDHAKPSKPVDAKAIASSAIPEGLKLQDSRSFGQNPTFVFAGYGDDEYKINLKVFVVSDDKIVKTYNTGVLEGVQINFNQEVQGNAWGKMIADNVPILPVSFYLGGNDWSRAFNKFFTVSGDNLIEIPVECEPGTVAGSMIEDAGKDVVPVYDCRFQMFDDLIHAISPQRAYLFEYDATKQAFVDATPAHPDYVKKAIDEVVKASADGENKADANVQASSMVSIYTQVEAGNVIDEYMPTIKTIMDRFPNDATVKKVWEQIQDAYTNKKPFATFAPWGEEMDYRWK